MSEKKPALKAPRNEKEGILNFSKEMLSALLTAVIFIVYVIQAFTIPTGSMEKSLRIGDFLLGLKFVYGSPVIPFTYAKFPGITSPSRGDVVIFKYPGPDKKDYIKRCVAVGGDTVRVDGKDLYVNGVKLIAPPEAQFVNGGRPSGGRIPQVDHFKSFYIPKKGDTLRFDDNTPLREFLIYKRIVHQELPNAEVTDSFHLYVNGQRDVVSGLPDSKLNAITTSLGKQAQGYWYSYDIEFSGIKKSINNFDSSAVVFFDKRLFVDGEEIEEYVCKYDNYFMVGDNRDNSSDSRFWGVLNKNFVKAKAFIIYFSLNREKYQNGKEVVPWIALPMKIRWNRMGKLIRRWDGIPEGVDLDNPAANSKEGA